MIVSLTEGQLGNAGNRCLRACKKYFCCFGKSFMQKPPDTRPINEMAHEQRSFKRKQRAFNDNSNAEPHVTVI